MVLAARLFALLLAFAVTLPLVGWVSADPVEQSAAADVDTDAPDENPESGDDAALEHELVMLDLRPQLAQLDADRHGPPGPPGASVERPPNARG
ncbi:MAG: hypothetical protein IPJ65_35420 [Archangiaceae bacterium]|nr:hypothetical protein [Archangiaceae bacterium]